MIEHNAVIAQGFRERIFITGTGAVVLLILLYFLGGQTFSILLLVGILVVGVVGSLVLLQDIRYAVFSQYFGSAVSIVFVIVLSISEPVFRYESFFFLQGTLGALLLNLRLDRKNFLFYIFSILLVCNQVYESFLSSVPDTLNLYHRITIVFAFVYLLPSVRSVALLLFGYVKEISRKNQMIADQNLILEKKKKELEAVNQELRIYINKSLDLERLAHISTHEIKSPIVKVDTFSKILRETLDERLTNEEKTMFGYMLEGSKELKTKVDKLFEYSYLNADTLTHGELDVNEMLTIISKDINQDIEWNIDANARTIAGDSEVITRIFREILKNASTFSSVDREMKIKIEARPENRGWYFAIMDNGIGIHEDFHQTVFLLFKRLHNQLSYPGHGFGLAYCKKAVELHDGKIWVESVLGQYSKFCFTIADKR